MSLLSPEQVRIIKSTVPVLQIHGNDITTRFYKDMLTEIPDLNNIFNQTNQCNGHQAAALAGSLCAYAAHVDDLGVLSPVMERISQKHASLYIQPEQYVIVGTYLLQAMKKVLGDDLTLETHDAWAAAYQQLANSMMNREAELLEEAGDWNFWRQFRISQKIRESSEIISFHLTPLDGKPLPSYLPGKYISIRISVPETHYLQARQYSLSDAPHPDHYRISVKNEQILDIDDPNAKANSSHIPNILHSEKHIGDLIEVSHPAGEFFLDTRQQDSSDVPVVLISAGVGLTPDLSIFNTLIAEDSRRKISWQAIFLIPSSHLFTPIGSTPSKGNADSECARVHGSRNTRVQAFRDHIRESAITHDNVQCHVFIKEPKENDMEVVDYQFTGRMSLNKLDADHDLFTHDSRTEYYICGPEKFMAEMEKYLEGQGVEGSRIKIEMFGTGEISKD